MDSYYNPYQQRPLYQQRQYQQMMPQPEVFNVKIASSKEEASATPGDYFKPTIILGLNHGAIYFKRFNQETGEMLMDEYRKPSEATQRPQYVTVESFDQFKNAVAQALNQMRGVEQSE